MNETPDTLRRRRRNGRKGAKDAAAPAEPAVRALIEQALHPEDAVEGDIAEPVSVGDAPGTTAGRARGRRRGRGRTVEADVASARHPADTPVVADPASPGQGDPEGVAAPVAAAAGSSVQEPPAQEPPDESSAGMSIYDRWRVVGQAPVGDGNGEWTSPEDDGPRGTGDDAGIADAGAPPRSIGGGPRVVDAHPAGHRWVYLAAAVFLLAIGFGLWGVWTTFFAGADADERSVAGLRARYDKLSQEAATLRRSDQISRDANRDLERTLADRDEEIAGLRADIAFYERFVGATGQRRGLSVHDLDMRLQGGDAWHFVATLTQNVNRGAVNTGRITLSLEGTRNDRLERLSWSGLRKQNNAPGLPYSFKYFQQVEGEVMLPKGFKPLRVTVRLVPQGGSAIEQSFPWPETVRDGGGG
ncbi:MAG: DUF6776 family protein [Pseudomonadota bacterium]